MRKQYITETLSGLSDTLPFQISHPEQKTCPACGQPFTPHKDRKRFCSQACVRAWWVKNCQKEFSAQGVRRRAELRESRREVAVTLPLDDDSTWALRANYWQQETQSAFNDQAKAAGNGKIGPPLILTGHGVQLRVERGALVARDGFTHYPQRRQDFRLYPGIHQLPARIVLLDSNGYLSLEVIQWLSQNHIPLVILNWQGEVLTAIGGDGQPTNQTIRQAQITALSDGTGMELAKQLIHAKVVERSGHCLAAETENEPC
jgi:hypothetical protein